MFLRRAVWEELGGWYERFDFPGGGLLNLDTYGRAIELAGRRVRFAVGRRDLPPAAWRDATNAPLENFLANWDDWHGQYRAIRGRDFRPAYPKTPPTFLGTLPRPALSHFLREALVPTPDIPPHLGDRFDRELWALEPPGAKRNACHGRIDRIDAYRNSCRSLDCRRGGCPAHAGAGPERARAATPARHACRHGSRLTTCRPIGSRKRRLTISLLGRRIACSARPRTRSRTTVPRSPSIRTCPRPISASPQCACRACSTTTGSTVCMRRCGRQSVLEIGVFNGASLARVQAAEHRHRRRSEPDGRLSAEGRDPHLCRNERRLLRPAGPGTSARRGCRSGSASSTGSTFTSRRSAISSTSKPIADRNRSSSSTTPFRSTSRPSAELARPCSILVMCGRSCSA